MKGWIETDEVNVLVHASADAPCFSIRSYESDDVRNRGKIIGLENVDIVRPPYPTLPSDVNLSAGQDELKKSAETCPPENQKKKEMVTAPCLTNPSVVNSTSISTKQLPQVAVHGKDGLVDIARERDLVDQKPDHSNAEKRAKLAKAADARAVQAMNRGIGDLSLVVSRKANDKDNATFGASRRNDLRKALSHSKAVLMEKNALRNMNPATGATSSSLQPSGTPSPPSKVAMALSYTPSLLNDHYHVSEALQNWVRRVAPPSNAQNLQCMVHSRDAGGGGDCFFHSVAAALELMMQLDARGAAQFVLRLFETEDFTHGKMHLVKSLRQKVATTVAYHSTDEEVLNFVISCSLLSQQPNWEDEWDPADLLRKCGFDALVHANTVDAFGDSAVRIDGPGGMCIPLKQGSNKLQYLRMELFEIFAACGNMHWATSTDVVALAEALGIGFIILSSDAQTEGGSHVYGVTQKRGDYEWWVVLYLRGVTHFTLAFWSHDVRDMNGCFFHISEIPVALRLAYNNSNSDCPIGQEYRGGIS